MSFTWRTLAASTALLMLCPQAGLADDVRDDLREMRETLDQLQEQLRAQEERIAEQEHAVEHTETRVEPTLRPDDGTQSALSSFLEQTDFSGFIAASYNWNTAGSGDRAIVGQNVSLFFHPDSNSFQVDQVWLAIDKAVSEKSRVGFHVDFLLGKAASLLDGDAGLLGNDAIEIFTAYASYLGPAGLQFDIGELPTLLGGEVVQANGNFNITRGLVWGLQPVTHTGFLVSKDFDSFTLKAGFVNDVFSDTNQDADDAKAFTGGIGFGGDDYSVGVSSIYGKISQPGPNVYAGVLDLLATLDPTDWLSIWYNFDYAFTDETGAPDFSAVGQALAMRFAVDDNTGVALRGEYVAVDDAPDAWSLTGTIDHTLAGAFKLRGEVRYDDTSGPDVFPNAKGTTFNGSAVTFLAEAVVEF